MSEHEIGAQRIFDSLRHVLATMEKSSLLENQDPSLLWLNIYKHFFASSTRRNPRSTTFHPFITQIDLDSNAGLSSIWELKLAIAMASEVMPWPISQEAKALIKAADILNVVLLSV